MKAVINILIAAMAFGGATAEAKVRLSSMFTDNMVLEQNENVRIFGQADPGAQVTVTPSWNGKTYTTTTDRIGEWSLAVETPAGSFTPYSITVSDGEPTTLDNVLIGEVWLASGQSNMDMPLKGFAGCNVSRGFDEVASAREQAGRIRMFKVPMSRSMTPVDTVNARWTVPSPELAPDYSAVAWYFAKRMSQVLDVPVGIVCATYGGSKVESWLPREILETYDDISLDPADLDKIPHYLRPLVMYNAMFYPIKDYVYKGIIWYQGCSNVGTETTYADRLETMVKHWREQIGRDDIPFFAVEIAPFEYRGNQSGKAPLLRQAQWDAIRAIPNSGMISTNDLVEDFERYNIHPGNKRDVGFRLCDLAINRAYGMTQMPCESPRYKSHRIEGKEVRLEFEAQVYGLCRNYDIRGFEVAGKDRIFHPADKVSLVSANEIVVSSDAVAEPVAVRYCWRDFQPGTLYGANHLPCIPFRTDNW